MPAVDFRGIDLTSVDLFKDVTISEKNVEVYQKDDRPTYGTKLNVPGIITLNRVEPSGNLSPE